MKFVCPQPNIWNGIYIKLEKAWKKSGLKTNPPPVPLILNGWAFSNDYDKNQRWQETVEWANQNGLASLIPELAENEQYCVVDFSSLVGYEDQ